ncbi:MAG: fumarylacetoacetate hydrolase family protein [Dehalococcoidia bacterium]|nr:fumarylacetoacetate hydrolase family protein [Dehalococcoidia bacterium]
MTIYDQGTFIGRVWNHKVCGPSIVTIRDNMIWDITSKDIPTMTKLLELDHPKHYATTFNGEILASLSDIENTIRNPEENQNGLNISLLPPCDLQAIKACGVTFANSMVERVIEERAAGDPKKADAIRINIGELIGNNLKNIIPGSSQAQEIKEILINEGIWSQYLEVGIGVDAEVFTKCPVLSSVGHGSDIGILPTSTWNNPEPEIVLAVNSRGAIAGATLGNDVNLRDIEGRSALLLGKSKDNNASCSIGPFIRLFDDEFGIEQVNSAELTLKVQGTDGYILHGTSSMREISRSPRDLVRQTCGANHQYPDGFMLFLGTLFAPTEDRDIPGEGFTHKLGDRVTISEPLLGELTNTVNFSTDCPKWEFGISSLMENLAYRKLL